MTRSVLLSSRDLYLLFKDGLSSVSMTDYLQDTYYKVKDSCVRRRRLHDKQGICLQETWIDVYGNFIHKPQVGRVLLQYRFTRHHLHPSKIKLDVLELPSGFFVVLTRLDCLFLGEELDRPCLGKVQLLTNDLDPVGYTFYSDPLLNLI